MDNKTGFIKNDKNSVPELCEKKENCCGCTACSAICPAHAISMVNDEEGFSYPEINAENCIRCEKCLKTCRFKADNRKRKYLDNSLKQESTLTPATYAVKHKNEDIRAASRSGGVFTALSDRVLSEGGVIYGCILDDKFNVKHIRAVTADERDRMRGSKYVQSDLSGIFQQVKEDLISGRKVLFSGTSCQISGLKGFLGREYDELLCIDIVCHGVPSPLVFHRYLEWQEKKEGSGVRSFDFRNKRDFGWQKHIETTIFENGKKVDINIFTTIFYGHTILRPCCYKCPYKSTVHPGDITIADYWGIDKAAPGFNDNKGVSLVLVNNDKGNELFGFVKDNLEVRETRLEDSIQPPLVAPFPSPENREQFWKDFHKKDFGYISKKYGTINCMKKLKKKIRSFLK